MMENIARAIEPSRYFNYGKRRVDVKNPYLLCYLFSPEAVGDVLERPVFLQAVEPLVGGRLVEWT